MGSPFGYKDIFIGSATPVKDVIKALSARGCSDLTSVIDSAACSMFPLAGGGFCDVYRGITNYGTPVAIKSLRIYDVPGKENGKEKMLKRAARELYHWSKLRHSNVLPLMGLAMFRGRISMISEWMGNGNLPSYISLNPGANRISLVHGDLKGANVMVSPEGIAVIADFGNSQLRDLTLRFTNTTNSNITVRWAAPELLDEESGASLSKKTDVYAYGMTVLVFIHIRTRDGLFTYAVKQETLTGKVPYDGFSEHQVIVMVAFKNKTPACPTVDVDAEMWKILLECWSREPSERPDIAKVESRLLVLYSHAFGEEAPDNTGLGGTKTCDLNPAIKLEDDRTVTLSRRERHSPTFRSTSHQFEATDQLNRRSIPKLSLSMDSMAFLDIPEELERGSGSPGTTSGRVVTHQQLDQVSGAESPSFEFSATMEASRQESPFKKVAPRPIPRRNRPPSLLTNLMSSVPKTYPPAAAHQHGLPAGERFRTGVGSRRPTMLQTRRSTIAMPMAASITAERVTTSGSADSRNQAAGFSLPGSQNHATRGLRPQDRVGSDPRNGRPLMTSELGGNLHRSLSRERTSTQYAMGIRVLGSGLPTSNDIVAWSDIQVANSGQRPDGELQGGDEDPGLRHLTLVRERSHIHDFHRAGW